MGGRRGRQYGRALGDFDGGYSSGGYDGRGRSRARNYDSYDDYDEYDDYYPESDLDDRRYSSGQGRSRLGFEEWGNLVGGAARRSWRSFENEIDGRRRSY